jgi:hypothetical protein
MGHHPNFAHATRTTGHTRLPPTGTNRAGNSAVGGTKSIPPLSGGPALRAFAPQVPADCSWSRISAQTLIPSSCICSPRWCRKDAQQAHHGSLCKSAWRYAVLASFGGVIVHSRKRPQDELTPAAAPSLTLRRIASRRAVLGAARGLVYDLGGQGADALSQRPLLSGPGVSSAAGAQTPCGRGSKFEQRTGAKGWQA